MLNSIYYGLALVAILLIMRWYILNDGKGQNDGSMGFLAMTKSKPPQPPSAKPSTPAKRSFRRES
jgi:hypothetical protein